MSAVGAGGNSQGFNPKGVFITNTPFFLQGWYQRLRTQAVASVEENQTSALGVMS